MDKKKKKQEEQVKETEEILEETVMDKEVESDDLTQTIEKLDNEVKSLKDALLRNQAELQNFKRRTNEERIKDRKYANLDLAKKLLPALDNFELALDKEVSNEAMKPLLKGFEMIKRDLFEALKEEGLEEVEALNNPFDPNYHQAVMQEATEGVESNMVVEVYQKGYMFKDRLLRPAMVKVSE